MQLSNSLHRAYAVLGRVLACAAAAMATSCGGGDHASFEESHAGRERAQAFTSAGDAIPADANVNGMWGSVVDWPLIPLHAVLLTDGRVLTFGTDGVGKQTGYFVFDVWDPAGGLGPSSHLTLPNSTSVDIFCSSPLLLPAGDGVAIAGGDNWTGTATTNTGNPSSLLFNGTTNSLTSGATMSRPRWYATSTALLNGEILVMGGLGGADRADVRGLDGTYRQLSVDTSFANWNYPRNFIAPDGRVFGFDVAGQMYYLDPTGSGSISLAGAFTETRDVDSTAVMFRPGKILQFGGSSDQALVIDINGATPSVTPTQRLSSQRRWVTSTVLPDGNVLATGGSRVANELIDVNLKAEIWDPSAGTWHLGASAAVARLYHSNAILLPDATVLVAGGGAPGPLTNLNAEVYYPSYLFSSDGTMAARPTITSAPTTLNIGQTATVDVDSALPISRVTFVKTGAVTHSFNFEQRFLELPFVRNGNRLSVQLPAVAAQAPPGTYMLFVLDDAGVPSRARIVRMNVGTATDLSVTPVMQQPVGQTSAAGQTVTLSIAATDPNGDQITFSASELPPGLSIDPTTGVISGVPTEGGTYVVTVYASDGINATSRTFTWTVAGSTAPLYVGLATDAPEPVSLVGTTALFSAAGQGSGVQYSWSFGDDSAATDWSSDGHASHAYAQPGAYLVTVTVRDATQATARLSFMQAVKLPAVDGTAATSSSLAIESLADGSYRVWMVNQDTDTVTVFDGATRNRVAEIAVGKSPRSIAIAANGRVWVTNKVSGTLSVIDPGTLAVVSSIPLGNGSRPHGLVFSPNRQTAYVTLEATGKVTTLNAGALVITGSTSVGANPRHLSINAAGTELWVSRYVTPPQPGESTAVVSSTLNGVKTGGEVLVLNTASMSPIKTVVLEHSDRMDSPFSGRGVPNYLGAAAISPDGAHAWVPSKQDNILRGLQRDGRALDFQTTVRAIASQIDLASRSENPLSRIDLNNSAVASAAVYDKSGVYLFVTLETSREIAILDAHRHYELLRVDAGRAPQGLALSPDGRTLFVENSLDRSLGAYDLSPLLGQGQQKIIPMPATAAIASEKLAANLLLGKQFFYDARDRRLARDGYMSCAACHNEGGSDGRVWDMTQMGEGLRRTIGFRGKGKDGGHGFRHWSGNFDEVQDFEGQIRSLAGGTGLMTDVAFGSGTTSQPLGSTKAGISSDLDALAAYVNSLNVYDPSPYFSTTPSAAVTAGKSVFRDLNCAACHAGTAFSSSGNATLQDIGTLKATSGYRLGGPLLGIDPPTLRGAWSQTSFLHDGSASTLETAIQAHKNLAVTGTSLSNLVAYLQTVGSEEPVAPANPGTGTGLTGDYFNNLDLGGAPVVSRVEVVDYTWGTASPAAGLGADSWSVRWSGMIEFPATGTYVVQIQSDDGVRLTINGQQVLNFWGGSAGTVTYLSPPISANAGDRVPIILDHYDKTGGSTVKLRWITPGATTGYVTVPADRLYPVINLTPTVTLAPPASASVGAVVNLLATASDADGTVTRVDFYDGATLIGSATAQPFSVPWIPASAGTHTLTARVTDSGGASATSAPIVVTVSPENLSPSALLLAPSAGTVGVQVSLEAAVGDSDGTIALVEFFDGGTLIGSSSAGVYTMYWVPTTVGTHALTVRATDNLGAVTTSATVYVAVSPPPNSPPSVALSAPASGTVGVAMDLNATASDTDGTVAKVEFFDGATLIGTSTASPYSVAWTPSAQGTHQITARATDDAGAVATSNGVAVTVSPPANAAPLVALSVPESGSIGVAMNLSANASDPDGVVVKVEYFDGTTLIGSSTTSPFAVVWTPSSAGANVITARATDNLGAVTTSRAVAVAIGPAPNQPPSVALSAPAGGTVGVAVTLSVTASDPDGTVAKVEYFAGSTLIGSATAAPFALNWTPSAAGVYMLSAQATDDAGAVTTSSASQITVAAAPAAGGLVGTYFANANLADTPVLSRVEAVSLVWTGSTSPGAGVPSDYWSARWVGYLVPPQTGNYVLYIVADDGIRVWLDGVKVVDSWGKSGNVNYNLPTLANVAGTMHSLRIEHFDGTGDSTVRLRWKTPSSPVYWADVPATALYSDP